MKGATDMIFEKMLIPDLVVKQYSDVTPEMIRASGKRALICDIDNTLATYDDPTPPAPLLGWIENMQENGVSVAFVSNNSWERVRGFNAELGLVAYAKAGKPSTRFLQMAVNDLGIDKSEAVLLGDQLLTDCAAAKSFGIPAIIVPPIKDKTTPFFKFKRWLEKPYMKKYFKMRKENRG